MHYSLLLTLGCTVFLSILIMVYLSKKNFNTLKNKIYKYMLFFSLLVLLTEILEVQFYHSYNSIAGDIFLNIHWFIGLLWSVGVLIYFICYLNKNKFSTIKDLLKDKLTKIILIIIVILLIIYPFVPFDEVDCNNITYLPGLCAYYSVGFMTLCIGFIMLYLYNAKNRTKDDVIAAFMIGLSGGSVMIFQLIFPHIAIFSCAIVSILFVVYITCENPALELADDMKKLKEEIDASSKVKTDVILSMSHDIRSPMNAIVNYSSSMEEATVLNKEEIETSINNILVSGKNLLNIIGDVLDISSSKNDTEADQQVYQLKTIMDDLINITQSRIGSKQIKLILNISDNVPKSLRGNSTKLYRIIMNILSNSAKYTDVGKITMSIDSTIDDNVVMLHIKVADTGFGIKEEDKAKVFSEFGRLKDATNSNIEGTGLGLINTKKNVENMGGKIWFESIYGAGTTFYMDIPQKVAGTEDLNTNVKDAKLKENLIDCKGKNVLIVDDNALNVKVITRLLERYNFNVDKVASGDDCIDKIKLDNKYDIIFMDVLLKGLDGVEIMKIIKQLNKIYDVPPVVALTANAVSGARNTYMKAGFDEYISKPIDINELDRVINMFFNNNNNI